MMKQLYQEMANLAARGESFVLATVITCIGSVPRSLGAKMLVRGDGTSVGTIGGGNLEAQVEQLARQVQQNHQAVTQTFGFNGKDATTTESICGGQVEIMVEWLDGSDATLAELLMSLNAAVANNHKVWWLTSLPHDGVVSKHLLIHQDGTLTGSLPAGLSLEVIIKARQPIKVTHEQSTYFLDPLDIAFTVYIFGAGHVSQSLVQFTRAVEFLTMVLDDRADFVNRERFPEADQLILLDAFSDAFGQVEVDSRSFLVIVTRGHLFDQMVLAQALRTSAGYIGMMGSRRKCALIFDEMRRQGFTDEDLQRVHAPIGVSIEAETPEELGISIVAELIQARARMCKKPSG